MSVDPLAEQYHWMTTYQFASNQVVHGREIEGLENVSTIDSGSSLPPLPTGGISPEQSRTPEQSIAPLNPAPAVSQDASIQAGTLAMTASLQTAQTPASSAGSNASGVSDDSLLRYIPVVGSALDARDAFGRGDWGWGIVHSALAVSDVFLVKSIVTGVGKMAFRAVAKSKLKREAAKGGATVYTSVSKGVTQYVGITNNVARRSAEHLASKGINIQP